MDDWGSPSMKELESLKDLSTPATKHFDFHHLEPLQVSTKNRLDFHISTQETSCDSKNCFLWTELCIRTSDNL